MSDTADLLQQLIDIRHKIASENLTGGRKKRRRSSGNRKKSPKRNNRKKSRRYSRKKQTVTIDGRTFKARKRLKGRVPSPLKPWNRAVKEARKELKIKGFRKIKKGTKLYKLAKKISNKKKKKKKRGASGKKKNQKKKRGSSGKKKR